MPRVNAKTVGNVKKPALVAKKNKLYDRPEKIKEGTILTDLSKKQWCIGPSIGTGGFGEIYSACRVPEKNYEYVVKCEPHGNGPLFVEMHFYMRNARLEDVQRFQREHSLKSLGMPYMVGNGSADVNGQKHRFIVMPRYGTDIAHHFIANGRRLPEGTIYRIALQMLDVYEFVHSSGYVHADLKGANILLGPTGRGNVGKSSSQVFLVDFGLASHYTTKDFKPDPKKMHNGTIEYTSRDAHQGVPTMRGDMEILGYNIIEWLGVQLPWVKSNLLSTPIKVQKAKEDFMNNINVNLKKLFPGGVPTPVAEYMAYVAKMKYNDVPDFEKCRKIFNNGLKLLKIPNSGDLEFVAKSNAKLTPPSTSKAKRPTKRVTSPAVISDEEVCASDDDDGDVRFEKRRTPKVTPNKVLKTVKVNKAKSPIHKISPRKLATSPSKATKKRTSPRIIVTPHSTNKSSRNEVSSSVENSTPRIVSSTSRSTPMSASANINFNPSVKLSRLGSSSRPGKTVINDNLTPNPQASKTYEFNFELDVSMDANVVVNVKRKKKASQSKSSTSGATPTSSVANSSGRQRDNSEYTGSPYPRVKVRKLTSDDENSGSPTTPLVTVKKSKRVRTPR